MKVLVVDDSRTVRALVRESLEAEGLEVVEAADGMEGLEKVRTIDPHVIICDVNMPVMNGLEMLQNMRDAGIRTPVAMLTTEGQPELIKRARTLGAKGWIVKPFNSRLLVGAVMKIGKLTTSSKRNDP